MNVSETTTTRTIDMPGRGISLDVLETGAGGRPLLLVHGFAAAKEDWAEHMDDFAALGFHAVAPDLRGHGTSDHPKGLENYTFGTVGDDLIRLAEALDWQSFVLFGTSIGGAIAQMVALTFPHRVEALILMNTPHTALDNVDPADIALGQQVVAEGGLALLKQAQDGRDDPTGTPAHTRMVATRPGYAEYGDRKLLACSPDMWRALVGEIFSQRDRLGQLATLEIPTLVIAGAQDAVFRPHCERIAAAMPNARLAVIDDAGHSPNYENPDGFWKAVSTFLKEI